MFFVLCVFYAFSHSLILFRVKVRFKVRVKVMVRIKVRVRVLEPTKHQRESDYVYDSQVCSIVFAV